MVTAAEVMTLVSVGVIVAVAVPLFVSGGELDVDRIEHREHHALKDTDENFQEIERKLEEHAHDEAQEVIFGEHVTQRPHGVQQVFTGEDVAVKSQRESDRTHADGNHFDDTDDEEDNDKE